MLLPLLALQLTPLFVGAGITLRRYDMSLKLPKMYDLVLDTRQQIRTIGNRDSTGVSSNVCL